MSNERVTEKRVLLEHFAQNWSALDAALQQLSPETMTTVHDEQGWTVRDHLIHLYYWERLALYFLQGKPFHEGLDVSAAIYASDDEDLINTAIYERHQAVPLDVAFAQLRALHTELLAVLEPLTDEDLQKSYRHYLPDEPSEGEGRPAMNIIYGTTAHHFAEHQAWIESLVAQKG